MDNKRFVIDLDVNDKDYRSKMNRLVADSNQLNNKMGIGGGDIASNLGASDRMAVERMRLQELQRDFNSRYSSKQIGESRYWVTYDEEMKKQKGFNPLTYTPRATAEQRSIYEQDKQLRELNKNLDDSQKLQRFVNYETRNRHQEYRYLSTTQLEQERKKLRIEATKLEKSGRFEESDLKRGDLQAINSIITQRTNQSPEERAIRQMATNMFMGNALNGVFSRMGSGGQDLRGAIDSGTGAYSAMRSAGASKTRAAVAGGVMAMFAELLSVGLSTYDTKQAYKQTRGVFGYSGNKVMDDYSSHFSKLGLIPEDVFSGGRDFSKKTGVGGDFIGEFYKSKLLEITMGVNTGDLQAFYKYGRGSNRVDAFDETRKYAYFLDAMKVEGVQLKNGAAEDLSRLPEYLQQLVSINEDIYKITGDKSRSNQELAINQMMSVIGLGGKFAQNPETATETLMGLRNSMKVTDNPVLQYYNMEAYRKQHPNAGFLDTMLGLENDGDIGSMNYKIQSWQSRYGFEGKIDRESGRQYEYQAIKDLQAITQQTNATKALDLYNQWVENGGLKDVDVNVDKTADFGATKQWAEDIMFGAKELGSFLKKLSVDLGNNFADFELKIQSATTNLSNFGKAASEAKTRGGGA